MVYHPLFLLILLHPYIDSHNPILRTMPHAAQSIYRNITVLFTACFAFLAGNFVMLLLDKGLSLAEVGLYFSIYSIAVFLLEVPTGAFADVYGRRKAILAAFVVEIVFLAGFLIFPSGLIFAGFALLGAAADAFFSGSAEAHAVDMLKERRKARFVHQLLASGKIYMYGTLLVGASIGGFLSKIDFGIPIALSMLMGFIGLAYAWVKLKETRRRRDFGKAEEDMLQKMKEALMRSSRNRVVRMLYTTSFLFGIGAVGLFTLWQPAFAELNGWDTSNLGFFFTLISIFAIAGAKLSGFFKASFRNYGLAMVLLWLLLMLSGIYHIPFWAPLLVLLWQVALGFIQPLESTLLNKHTQSDIRATVISIKNLNWRLSFGLVSLLLYLIGSFSIADVWIATSLAFLIGAALVLRMRKD
jgi:MFS family permease